MLSLDFDFLARRYHATPWGHQVNEAQVEWPPSPWRLVRALVAAWHRLEEPETEEVGRSVVGKLASCDPVYRVPPYTEGHTRHYMPTAKSSTLIFDAFVQLGDLAVLEVDLPGVELTHDELTLLERMIAQLSYLGRAESWVHAAVRTGPSPRQRGLTTLRPGRTPGAVRMPAAQSPDEYEQWAAQARKAYKKRAEKPPPDLWGALRMGTAQIQKGHWSRPPGMRDASYDLAQLKPVRPRYPRVPHSRDVQVARFALVPMDGVLPRFRDGLFVADALHQALAKLGDGREVPLLTGTREGVPLRNEGHAYVAWTAGDAPASKERVSHLHVALPGYVPGTSGNANRTAFSAEEVRVLQALRALHVSLPGRGSHAGFRVVLEGLWTGADLEQLRGLRRAPGALQKAVNWESKTPVVLHRHPKRRGGRFVKDAPCDQVKLYLQRAGFPPAEVTMLESADRGHWAAFRRRRGGGRSGAGVGAWAFRLRFDEPVVGPVAVGALAHFGMGRFAPVGG